MPKSLDDHLGHVQELFEKTIRVATITEKQSCIVRMSEIVLKMLPLVDQDRHGSIKIQLAAFMATKAYTNTYREYNPVPGDTDAD